MTEAARVYPVLLNLVADDSLRRVQQLGRALATSTRSLKRILYQVALVSLNRTGEGKLRHGAGAFRSL